MYLKCIFIELKKKLSIRIKITWARRLNTIYTYLPVYVGLSIQMVFLESPASSVDDEVDLLGWK